MSDQTTVADLVRRLKGRCRFLRAENPERRLFEECIAAVTELAVRLRQVEQGQRPTFELAGTVERAVRNGITIERAAEAEPNGEEATSEATRG